VLAAPENVGKFRKHTLTRQNFQREKKKKIKRERERKTNKGNGLNEVIICMWEGLNEN